MTGVTLHEKGMTLARFCQGLGKDVLFEKCWMPQREREIEISVLTPFRRLGCLIYFLLVFLLIYFFLVILHMFPPTDSRLMLAGSGVRLPLLLR